MSVENLTTASLPTSGRAQPAHSEDTRFFWEGTRAGMLLVQRCSDCGLLRHPPAPGCPECGSLEWTSTALSGHGTIHSYVVQHHPLPPGFDGPAVIVLVELEEGVRMIGNLLLRRPPGNSAGHSAASEPVEIGAEVEAFFLPQAEGWTAPQFRLVR